MVRRVFEVSGDRMKLWQLFLHVLMSLVLFDDAQDVRVSNHGIGCLCGAVFVWVLYVA